MLQEARSSGSTLGVLLPEFSERSKRIELSSKYSRHSNFHSEKDKEGDLLFYNSSTFRARVQNVGDVGSVPSSNWKHSVSSFSSLESVLTSRLQDSLSIDWGLYTCCWHCATSEERIQDSLGQKKAAWLYRSGIRALCWVSIPLLSTVYTFLHQNVIR